MSEELTRFVAQLGERVATLEQNVSEHRHWRDPQWDLWSRRVNSFARTSWDSHFRSGAIPAGYAWQGAPFGGAPGGAGGLLDFSFQGTYLRVICDASPHFLSRVVGSFLDKWFVARVDTGNGTTIGIRADDGTNNNYVEFYLNPGANNIVRPKFTFVTGGGAPVTNASPAVRSDIPHSLLLLYQSAVPQFAGFTTRESSRFDGDNNHQTGAIVWTPTRIGLILRNNAGFSACCDLIYNEYV